MKLHECQVRPAPLQGYIAPVSLEDALETLARLGPSARPVAGGTDLLLELSRGARPEVDTLVDLSTIEGLDSIVESNGRVTLSALTSHADIVESDLMHRAALPLAQACLEVGSPQLRNRATVAGNIVTASPANDTISALYALGADITIRSQRAERVVPIVDFFVDLRQTILEPDELVTGISFDALDETRRGIFVKLGLRRAQAISVVHAAAVVQHEPDGTVNDLRVALGCVGPTIRLVENATGIARGRRLDRSITALAEAARSTATPIDDLRAPADYRTRTIGVVVERALRSLGAGSEAETWPGRSPRLKPRSAQMPSPSAPPSPRQLSDSDPISAEVNGAIRSAAKAVSATLLDWLRDELGLTGTKEGCAEGECGACTVHLDGSAVLACLVPAAAADGCRIVTIEGLAPLDHQNLADPAPLHPLQQAFETCGGVQCGFCTPGFVMSAAMLLEEIPHPTRLQVEQGLAGNLCRCTGYYGIIEALQTATAASVKAQPPVLAGPRSKGEDAAEAGEATQTTQNIENPDP